MQSFKDLMTASLAEAGLSDEQVTAALEKIYNHEKLSPKLNALVKTATEDYQAQLGRVRAYQEWYSRAEPEYNRMNEEYTRVMQQLVEQQNGNNTPQFDASRFISKDDFIAMQREQAQRTAAVLKETAKITAKHLSRFRDDLDIEAIDRLATEHNLPLMAAYEKFIEPRLREEEQKKNEEWKKNTREEIERDLRSRYQLPAEQVPTEQSPLFTHHKAEDLPKDVDSDLLSTWRSVPAKT